MIDQPLPCNLDAEQNCIGSMLREEEAAHIGFETLEYGNFYRPAHQILFQSMHRIYSRDGAVDLTTIQADLNAHKQLDKIGGTDYIFACVESVPTAANIKHYAELVIDMFLRRKIIENSRLAIEKAYDLEELAPLDKFLSLAMDIQEPGGSDMKTLAPILSKVYSDFEKIAQGEKGNCILYGIPHLDNIIHGITLDAEFTIIGGRPSSGKTILLLMLALEVIRSGHRVLFFSQETSAEKLIMRLVRNLGNVDDTEFRECKDYQKEAFDRISEVIAELYSYDDMFLVNDASVTVSSLRAKAKRQIAKYQNTDNKVGAIILDYIQILESEKNYNTRNDEVQHIAQSLHRFTGNVKIPIIAASQLRRIDGTPTLADLREGGNQEGEAEKVILIDNPPSEFPSPTRDANLIIAKNKDGRLGKVPVTFNGAHMRFEQ